MKRKQIYLSILTVFTAFLIFIIIQIFSNREKEFDFDYIKNDQTNPSFEISINKKQANKLANKYLDELQEKSKIKYTFLLENYAVFIGEIKVFDQAIKLYLYLKPERLEDGNLKFTVESVSIGKLLMPTSEILKYINKEYNIPNWVNIDAKEETITMYLDKFIMKDGTTISASRFDLVNDEIGFDVTLKNED